MKNAAGQGQQQDRRDLEDSEISLSASFKSVNLETNVQRVNPHYDAGFLGKLESYFTEQEYASTLMHLRQEINAWRQALPRDGRLIFVSDPWIAEDFRGGSHLLRNFYGLLAELQVPVEWWTLDIADDEQGHDYHSLCYALYRGLKGEDAPSREEHRAGYLLANRQFAKELLERASINGNDQIVLLDINAMGIAPFLAQSVEAPQRIIENLRIGNPIENAEYRSTIEFLRELGIYNALDCILHLHESFISNREKECCIGGFFCFTDASHAPLPASEAVSMLNEVVERSVHVGSLAQFWDVLAHGETIIHCGKKDSLWRDDGGVNFYLGARIDSSKNQSLAIKTFADALRRTPEAMEQARLTLLAPTPSCWNNSVERAAINNVLEDIFHTMTLLSDQEREHLVMYFVPPHHDAFVAPNFQVNRALQNLSSCHLCLSSAEGLPNSIFEAMHLKKATLVHGICGMEAQVEHTVTGIKTTLEDASVAEAYAVLARDGSAVERMGIQAYQRLITMFSPLAYTTRFFEVLNATTGRTV